LFEQRLPARRRVGQHPHVEVANSQLERVGDAPRLDVLADRPEGVPLEDGPQRLRLRHVARAARQMRAKVARQHRHAVFERLEALGRGRRVGDVDLHRRQVGAVAAHLGHVAGDVVDRPGVTVHPQDVGRLDEPGPERLQDQTRRRRRSDNAGEDAPAVGFQRERERPHVGVRDLEDDDHVVLPPFELAALLEVLPAAVDGDEDREILVPFQGSIEHSPAPPRDDVLEVEQNEPDDGAAGEKVPERHPISGGPPRTCRRPW
jgi:hypothetical protein